ncbi:MAG: ArsA family ATPase [Deltaproteobacteria bacterium]|nr:ArsA family ATPase [Deltaproteobacteria bacterium]
MARNDLCPVMLFSGKGGVGKTTLAAATAVRLARDGTRVLIVSTDPAHSLSDVFDTPLGPTPRPVIPGLDAMEVDAKGMFSSALPSTDVGDEETATGALAKLMQMASQTPGVDEFGAIEVLMSAVEEAQHDVVILDTAPTGHTLRLLMLPELLDGWLGTLLTLRGHITRAGRLLRRFLPRAPNKDDAEKLEEGLLASRHRIAELRDLLRDPNKAQIFLVTIPEALGVMETLRTFELLKKQGLPVGSIVVNQLQPQSDTCVHCRRRRTIHDRELGDLRTHIGDTPLRIIESLDEEIRGAEALEAMGERLWAQLPELSPQPRSRDAQS